MNAFVMTYAAYAWVSKYKPSKNNENMGEGNMQKGNKKGDLEKKMQIAI